MTLLPTVLLRSFGLYPQPHPHPIPMKPFTLSLIRFAFKLPFPLLTTPLTFLGPSSGHMWYVHSQNCLAQRSEPYTTCRLPRISLYSLEGRYEQSPRSKRVLKLLEMLLKQLMMALDLKHLVGMDVLNH